jgi:hypothetical protein
MVLDAEFPRKTEVFVARKLLAVGEMNSQCAGRPAESSWCKSNTMMA